MPLSNPTISQRKKLSWQFGCLTSVGLFLILLVVLNSIQVVQYELYKNPFHGFSVKYPANWELMETPQGGAVVAFLSPKENEMDAFRENVNISYQDLARSPMNLRQFSQMAMRQLTMTFGDAIEVVQDSGTTLAGRPAHRFSYAGTEPQGALQIMHVWVMDGDRAFILTYTARKEDFNKSLGGAKGIINSFQIGN